MSTVNRTFFRLESNNSILVNNQSEDDGDNGVKATGDDAC